MRYTSFDATNLCDHYMGFNSKKTCDGCRLSGELDKPSKKRNRKFMARIRPRVLKLRRKRIADNAAWRRQRA